MTIWGESAGAGSVIQQLVANGGKTNPPLFRAAMTSSTFLPSQYSFNDRIPEVRVTRVTWFCRFSDTNLVLLYSFYIAKLFLRRSTYAVQALSLFMINCRSPYLVARLQRIHWNVFELLTSMLSKWPTSRSTVVDSLALLFSSPLSTERSSQRDLRRV